MTSWDFAALVAIFLLGVPHGGFDTAIARRSGWPMDSRLSWAVFHLAYIAIAAAVAILWWWFPAISLGLFLLISGYHFGSSDIAEVDTNWLAWLAHGGFVPIAIPSLNPETVKPIFSILVGANAANNLLSISVKQYNPRYIFIHTTFFRNKRNNHTNCIWVHNHA